MKSNTLIIIIPTSKGYSDRFKLFIEQSKYYDKTIVISRNLEEFTNTDKINYIDLKELNTIKFILKSREIISKNAKSSFVFVNSYLFNWALLYLKKNVFTITTTVHSDISYFLSNCLIKMILKKYDFSTIIKTFLEMFSRVIKTYISVVTSDGILSNTYADLKYYPKKSKDYYNSEIDNEFFRLIKSKKSDKIIFVGSLQYRKNIDLLYKLVEKLSDRFYFTVVGNNGYNDQHIDYLLNDMIQNYGVKYYSKLNREELLNEYNKNYIFISPSFFEGSPRTLKEALSCGLECIASDIPGHLMLEKEFENLYVVKNELDYYIEKINYLRINGSDKKSNNSSLLSFSQVAITLSEKYKILLQLSKKEK